MTKKTVGAIAAELLQKPDGPTNPQEYQRAQEKDYLAKLLVTAQEGLKLYNSDFYIVVITKKERLMENVIRNYFFSRKTCPTPDYDQTVYKFNHGKDDIEFLWTIPAKDICFDLLENKHRITREEQDLLECVMRYAEGTLMKLAQSENKEFA